MPCRLTIPTLDLTPFNDAEVLLYIAIQHQEFFNYMDKQIELARPESYVLTNILMSGATPAAMRNTQRVYRAWGTMLERLLKLLEAEGDKHRSVTGSHVSGN